MNACRKLGRRGKPEIPVMPKKTAPERQRRSGRIGTYRWKAFRTDYRGGFGELLSGRFWLSSTAAMLFAVQRGSATGGVSGNVVSAGTTADKASACPIRESRRPKGGDGD